MLRLRQLASIPQGAPPLGASFLGMETGLGGCQGQERHPPGLRGVCVWFGVCTRMCRVPLRRYQARTFLSASRVPSFRQALLCPDVSRSAQPERGAVGGQSMAPPRLPRACGPPEALWGGVQLSRLSPPGKDTISRRTPLNTGLLLWGEGW